MFGWFKKKPKADGSLPGFVEEMFRPLALGAAVGKLVVEYQADLKAGRVTAPASQRDDASALEVWRDTRIEALSFLWALPASEPAGLADSREQVDLLEAFNRATPHPMTPLPESGNAVQDTLSCVLQVYVYLDKIGTTVGDRETCRFTLQLAGRTVLSDLEESTGRLEEQWKAFTANALQPRQGPLPKMPETFFDLIYRDVTRKSRSIALSSRFGPSYEEGIASMLELTVSNMKASGMSAAKVAENTKRAKALMDQLLHASDPDELAH